MNFFYNQLGSLSLKTLLLAVFLSMFFWVSLLVYLIYADQYILAIFTYGIGIIDFVAGLAFINRARNLVAGNRDEYNYNDLIPGDFGWDEKKMDWLPETEISSDESEEEEEELTRTLRNSGIDPK